MGILTAILIALLSQQPRPAVASVRGVVLAVGTSQPVAKAVVQLRTGASSEPLTVTTGVDGRFEFRNVVPGSYQLTASRSGYLNTSNRTIQAGATINDIRLMMMATGAISGRVLDDSGEPLANIPVQALTYSYSEGQRTLTPVKEGETNDLGEFRVFFLPPGRYYISAQTRDTSSRFSVFVIHGDVSKKIGDASEAESAARKLGEAYVPVYYPGTASLQSATQVEVRPGADVRGIDFTLARVQTKKIRGVVIDSTTGQPVDANVQLVPRGGSTAAVSSYAPTDGGRFQVSGVLPGSYYLVATARLGPSDDVKIVGGRTPVDLGGSDLENLVVTLRPAIDIAGTVTVEGRTDGLPRDFHPAVTLQALRDGFVPGGALIYASFRNAAQFEFDRVVEGDYRIAWPDLPPGMYLKSIRLGPADALNGSVHIDSRTTDRFQIVVGTDAGTLEGVVVDSARNPVVGAQVVLVPDAARRQRTDLVRAATADEFGRYRLQGIPPGTYSLFAWEDIETGLWQDPDFIRRNEASGKPVRIAENSREVLEIAAIPFGF